MTIEEAKQMTTQGDIRAMCSLGDFYIKQNMNITVRQSRQSGVARATCPD